MLNVVVVVIVVIVVVVVVVVVVVFVDLCVQKRNIIIPCFYDFIFNHRFSQCVWHAADQDKLQRSECSR